MGGGMDKGEEVNKSRKGGRDNKKITLHSMMFS